MIDRYSYSLFDVRYEHGGYILSATLFKLKLTDFPKSIIVVGKNHTIRFNMRGDNVRLRKYTPYSVISPGTFPKEANNVTVELTNA